MSQPRPDHAQIEAQIRVADRHIGHAAETRKKYGRRRSPRRKPTLLAARDRCAEAAKPLRSWLGMVAWEGIDVDDELAMKRTMERLRYERRQIDKMLAKEK